ncbi:hypothetical protein Tco_0824803, partial [Tanacetum coccineum]
SSGPTTLVADETVHEERGDSMERAATTAASLDAEQDSVNTLGSREDRLKIMEFMEIYTKLSVRVLALENIKTAQDLEIINLKKRVKKLEKKKKARIPQLKRRLLKVRIESSADKSLETQGRYDHDIDVTTASTLITTAGVSVSTAKSISSETDLRPTKGVTIQEPSESRTRQPIPPSQHDPIDKGKSKMIEPEKPSKKKDHIKFDEEMAKRLVEELEAELEEEEKLAKQRE